MKSARWFCGDYANVIYCITCPYCNKFDIGETGRRLGDRFREHLRDVERNDKDASKPVNRHFNLPNHSKQHIAVCGPSLHLGSSESRKTLEQKFICQIGIPLNYLLYSSTDAAPQFLWKLTPFIQYILLICKQFSFYYLLASLLTIFQPNHFPQLVNTITN